MNDNDYKGRVRVVAFVYISIVVVGVLGCGWIGGRLKGVEGIDDGYLGYGSWIIRVNVRVAVNIVADTVDIGVSCGVRRVRIYKLVFRR